MEPAQPIEQPVRGLDRIDHREQRAREQGEIGPQRGPLAVCAREPQLVRQDLAHVLPLGVLLTGQQVGLPPVGDRGQVGEPRPHAQDVAEFRLEQAHVAGQLGARAHEAHLAAEHVEELRQLVELAVAQPAADRRHPRVAARGHAGSMLLRAHDHGPELEHVERDQVSPHPLLPEERGTAVGEAHGGGHEKQDGRRDHETDRGEQ